MANSVTSIEYVTTFKDMLDKKYATELKSYALSQSNSGITFLNEKTIKVPKMVVGGFKPHTRGNAFNTVNVSDAYETFTLNFDRDAEFIIDAMDVNESNLVMSIANIQNTFEETQAIPELDAYRFSKIYGDLIDPTKGNKASSVNVVSKTASDVLTWIDDTAAIQDDKGVPSEGRILYVTSEYRKLINRAMTRQLTAKDKAVETAIDRLGEMEIVTVPSARFATAYDFTNGFAPTAKAGKIGMIMIHPSAVIARDKYAYMKVFTPGSDSRTADAYIYQIRKYGDIFLLENKYDGIDIALDTAPTP